MKLIAPSWAVRKRRWEQQCCQGERLCCFLYLSLVKFQIPIKLSWPWQVFEFEEADIPKNHPQCRLSNQSPGISPKNSGSVRKHLKKGSLLWISWNLPTDTVLASDWPSTRNNAKHQHFGLPPFLKRVRVTLLRSSGKCWRKLGRSVDRDGSWSVVSNAVVYQIGMEFFYFHSEYCCFDQLSTPDHWIVTITNSKLFDIRSCVYFSKHGIPTIGLIVNAGWYNSVQGIAYQLRLELLKHGFAKRKANVWSF